MKKNEVGFFPEKWLKGGLLADFTDANAAVKIGRWVPGRDWKSDLEHTMHCFYCTEGQAQIFDGRNNRVLNAGDHLKMFGSFRVEGGSGLVVMHLGPKDQTKARADADEKFDCVDANQKIA